QSASRHPLPANFASYLSTLTASRPLRAERPAVSGPVQMPVSNRFLAIARLGAVSLPALAMAIPDEAPAQTALPGIVVNAPSPIVRHARPAPASPARTARHGATR